MASLSETREDDPKAVRSAAGAERGRQIVAAAFDLLEEEGLEGLTIRAVLKRTGLARRAFYERFAGKDDLVLAVFEQTLLMAAGYFRAKAEEIGDPLNRLRLVVSSIVIGNATADIDVPFRSSGRRNAALSREHLRLAEARPAELQAALAPLLGLIAEIVAAGIARGQFRACDPALQATLIYNLVSTTVHTEMIAEEGGKADPQRRARLSDEIWEFCRRAIAA